MPTDLKKLLRDALDRSDAEEKEEELEGRFAKIDARLEELANRPNPDQDELDALQKQLRETREELDALKKANDDDDNNPPPTDDDNDPPKPKTRAGRKSGNAYDWDVDDDGKVVRLDMAKVYTGEDEPDEVEVPA